MKHRYYIIEGGRPAELFRMLEEHTNELRKKARDLAAEVGAYTAYTDINAFKTSGNRGVVGFAFKESEAPKGWVKARNCKEDPGCVALRPSSRSKEGKTLLAKMDAVCVTMHNENHEFYALFGYEGLVIGEDFRVYHAIAGYVGKAKVVIIPVGSETAPEKVPGARQIKKWEFEKLKSEAGE